MIHTLTELSACCNAEKKVETENPWSRWSHYVCSKCDKLFEARKPALIIGCKECSSLVGCGHYMPTDGTHATIYTYKGHYHCWEQKQPFACRISLEKHDQCCLCDMKVPKEKECEIVNCPFRGNKHLRHEEDGFEHSIFPSPTDWMTEERELWDDTSKCYDITGSIRPIVTAYWLSRMESHETALVRKMNEAFAKEIDKVREEANAKGYSEGSFNGENGGFNEGRKQERDRIRKMIEEIRSIAETNSSYTISKIFQELLDNLTPNE